MKALGDAVIQIKSPHADNRFIPAAHRFEQRLEVGGRVILHLLHERPELANMRSALPGSLPSEPQQPAELLLELIGRPQDGLVAQQPGELLALSRTQIGPVLAQHRDDATLPTDVRLCFAAEIQQRINHQTDNVEAVGHDLGAWEEALHNAAKLRAEIHADHLDSLSPFELPECRFKLGGFFTFNDFVDAVTLQINE